MKLASIELIHSITPHPDPEVTRIECAKILGWPVVVPKGQYKEGDTVAFITIDSIVPERPEFEFLRKQKFRVWNAKFKGQISSGLVQPLSILPEGNYNVGDDLTNLLGISKFERPIDVNMNGDAEGQFPTNLISISDELNLLSYPEALQEIEGKEVVITLKVDGSSTSLIYNNGEFMACSRRLVLKEGQGFPWMAVAKYDIKNKMVLLGRNLALQCETIGPKMNGNSLELKELEIRVFRIKDLDTKEILSYDEMVEMCAKLNLPPVSLIERFVFDKEVHTVEYFRELANKQVWPTNGKCAEGVVIAPNKPFYSETLGKMWSVKVINQDYK